VNDLVTLIYPARPLQHGIDHEQAMQTIVRSHRLNPIPLINKIYHPRCALALDRHAYFPSLDPLNFSLPNPSTRGALICLFIVDYVCLTIRERELEQTALRFSTLNH
jgi:hypothetical protein